MKKDSTVNNPEEFMDHVVAVGMEEDKCMQVRDDKSL